jgi:hypothetical protein
MNREQASGEAVISAVLLRPGTRARRWRMVMVSLNRTETTYRGRWVQKAQINELILQARESVIEETDSSSS